MDSPIKKKRCKQIIRRTIEGSVRIPYRILGQKIRQTYKDNYAFESVAYLSLSVGWDIQTINRIFRGSRRTDFVEAVILAATLTNNEADFEKTILDWSKSIFNLIREDDPIEWK